MMKKPFRKIARGVLAYGMIVSLLSALPPLGVLATRAYYEDIDLNAHETTTFDKLDVSEITLGIARCLPEKSGQADLASRHLLLSHFLLRYTKNYMGEEVKLTSEFYHYFFDNDLDFNFPLFSCRQAPPEHASEG